MYTTPGIPHSGCGIFSSARIRATIGTEGRVAEWSMATVLKTVRPARVSWVRIPPLPPKLKIGIGSKNAVGAKRRLFCIPPTKS